jgi:hypothetical protein
MSVIRAKQEEVPGYFWQEEVPGYFWHLLLFCGSQLVIIFF